MFLLQLKTTDQVNFKKDLLRFIMTAYEVQDSTKLESTLDRFDKLRAAAVSANTPSEASYKAILNYVKELDYLSHLPIGDKRCKLSFKWNHAYVDKKKIEGFDYHLDKISFLYNLAVLRYQEAIRYDTSTEDQIKICGKVAKEACATLKTVIDMSRKRLFNVTKDLEDTCLEVVYGIIESFLSELTWMVAILKNSSPGLCASLSVRCYEAYQMLSGMLSSESVKKEFPRSFPKIAKSKEIIFQAESRYLSGLNEYQNKRYGVALRFYQDAKADVDLIEKKGYMDGMSSTFSSFVSRNLITKCKKDYEQLEKDNRIIYHETVPQSASFPQSKNIVIVEPFVPETVIVNDESDPFKNLIPIRVKALLSDYENRAQNKVNTIKENNNNYVNSINQIIAALGLPMSLYEVLGQESGLSEVENSNGLAEIIDDLRATGVQGMMAKHSDLMKAAEKNRNMIIKLISEINTLYMEDTGKVTKYGKKWNSSGFRTIYQDIYNGLDKLQKKLGMAISTDEIISKRIQSYAPEINIAQQYVIKNNANAPKGEETPVIKAANAVKELYDKIYDKISKFKTINNALNQKLTIDKPVSDLLSVCGNGGTVTVTHPRYLDAVKQNLEKYSEEENEADALKKEIDGLIGKLKELNQVYLEETRKMGTTGAKADNVKLGLTRYNEIRNGINNGIMFYTEFNNRSEQLDSKIKALMANYNAESKNAERALAGGASFVMITGLGLDPNNPDPDIGSPLGTGDTQTFTSVNYPQGQGVPNSETQQQYMGSNGAPMAYPYYNVYAPQGPVPLFNGYQVNNPYMQGIPPPQGQQVMPPYNQQQMPNGYQPPYRK